MLFILRFFLYLIESAASAYTGNDSFLNGNLNTKPKSVLHSIFHFLQSQQSVLSPDGGTLILPSPVCCSDEILHVWSVASLRLYNLADMLEKDNTFPNTSTLEKLWTPLLQRPRCPSRWLWGCLWGFHWHTEACFSPRHGKTMTSVERQAEIFAVRPFYAHAAMAADTPAVTPAVGPLGSSACCEEKLPKDSYIHSATI